MADPIEYMEGLLEEIPTYVRLSRKLAKLDNVLKKCSDAHNNCLHCPEERRCLALYDAIIDKTERRKGVA